MKTYLLYGFLLALAGFLVNLILFIAGFQSDVAHIMSTRWAGFGAGVVFAIVLLGLAIKARRDAVPPEEAFGYGWALWAGIATQLFASGFGFITAYLYVAFINPALPDLLLRAQSEKMEAMGRPMSDQQAAMMRHFVGPLAQGISTFFLTLVIGTLLAFILAIFLRRSAPRDPLAL